MIGTPLRRPGVSGVIRWWVNSMDTRAAAEKWGCTDRDVRDWCRGGHIAGSTKEKRKWLIPDDAQRPLDRKLQREILWQVLRRKDNRRRWIDLTRWGVSDDKIADYIALLLSTCLRRTPDAEEIGSIDDIELTEKGFSMEKNPRQRIYQRSFAGALLLLAPLPPASPLSCPVF